MPVRALDIRSRARDDLNSITAYISEDNPDAAQALHDEIVSRISTLPESPYVGRPGYIRGTRELIVRRNYIVIYRVTRQAVSVLRVKHAAMSYAGFKLL